MNEKDRHKKTPYPLRMPDELRVKLEKASGESGRSMNAEILARLQASFEEVPELEKSIEKLVEEVSTAGIRIQSLESKLASTQALFEVARYGKSDVEQMLRRVIREEIKGEEASDKVSRRAQDKGSRRKGSQS